MIISLAVIQNCILKFVKQTRQKLIETLSLLLLLQYTHHHYFLSRREWIYKAVLLALFQGILWLINTYMISLLKILDKMSINCSRWILWFVRTIQTDWPSMKSFVLFCERANCSFFKTKRLFCCRDCEARRKAHLQGLFLCTRTHATCVPTRIARGKKPARVDSSYVWVAFPSVGTKRHKRRKKMHCCSDTFDTPTCVQPQTTPNMASTES